MALGRDRLHATLLGDGRVLVLGDEAEGTVRADSAWTEIWDPAGDAWSVGPSLNAPRAEFAAVPVGAGGVLVTGGVTAGVTVDSEQDRHQSYSSTYVLDARNVAAGWSRSGLLDHARTDPSAATLPDGRVLVTGGYYLSGATGLGSPVADAVTIVYRRASGPPARARLDDVAPPTLVPALATSELYDPAAGTWSATGPLHYARVGAPAVTLADGRGLVAGSGPGSTYPWNYTEPRIADRAFRTAEVYDPASGRFTLTGDLPDVDWSPLAQLGPYPILSQGITSTGTLVALADGGALLVGQVTSWSIGALDLAGTTVRTLRLDPAGATWALVDQAIYASDVADEHAPTKVIEAGHSRQGAVAVALRDGRVLVAGGTGVSLTAAAELYDPASGAWYTLPPMPETHAGGAGVLLADGSVLVVGGHGASSTCDGCGIPATVRFFPG